MYECERLTAANSMLRNEQGRLFSVKRIFQIAIAIVVAHPAMAQNPPDIIFLSAGANNPAFHSFDDFLTGFMDKHHIPGGAIAVLKDGRLVYAQGYGFADKAAKTSFNPTTLARIASVSKPITAVAIMQLVQEGKLNLDAKAFRLLGLEPFLKPGAKVDPRIWDITVRRLLQHTGGWDRDKSGDVMFMHFKIAADMKIPSPPDHTSLIRWVMGRPLDFDPGTKYAYSNFGYCVLGRIIEKVTGKSYESYVREAVLAPLGITRMRIGKGREKERLDGEAVYYANNGRRRRTEFSEDGDVRVPTAYAFASPETMDAHGGWIASVVDIARFAAGMDGRGPKRVLNQESMKRMYEEPPPPVLPRADTKQSRMWYGGGWNVRPMGKNGEANYWHSGGMPGTASLLVRRYDGITWAVIFNSDLVGDDNPQLLLDRQLHVAANAVKEWPKEDLFDRYH